MRASVLLLALIALTALANLNAQCSAVDYLVPLGGDFPPGPTIIQVIPGVEVEAPQPGDVYEFDNCIHIEAAMPQCACGGQTMTLMRGTASGGPYTTQIGDALDIVPVNGGVVADNIATWSDITAIPGVVYYYVMVSGAVRSPEYPGSIPVQWWAPAPGVPEVTQQ